MRRCARWPFRTLLALPAAHDLGELGSARSGEDLAQAVSGDGCALAAQGAEMGRDEHRFVERHGGRFVAEAGEPAHRRARVAGRILVANEQAERERVLQAHVPEFGGGRPGEDHAAALERPPEARVGMALAGHANGCSQLYSKLAEPRQRPELPPEPAHREGAPSRSTAIRETRYCGGRPCRYRLRTWP